MMTIEVQMEVIQLLAELQCMVVAEAGQQTAALALQILVMVHQEAVAAEVVLMAIKATMAMLLFLMADMAITEAMELPKQAVVVAEELLPQEPVAIVKKEVLAEAVDM
jgi:hypothetical protein